MAKKKTNTGGQAILAEYDERSQGGESLAAIYADMKQRLRSEGADEDAMALLLDVHRRRNAGETVESIAERIDRANASTPATEAAPE